MPNRSVDSASVLRKLFGDNRAEWPAENFKDLFVSPAYITKLESLRPCILVGGRGTGKTTSLQSLKYDATLERLGSDGMDFGDQEYLGVLVRMNKNRVRAFCGDNANQNLWTKAFAHYFNLLVCLELAELTIWLESRSDTQLSAHKLSWISTDLGLSPASSTSELKRAIKHAISELQICVNNPRQLPDVTLSIAEAPLRTFAESLAESGLSGDRVIFCCIDEYENLLDYQQAILNTYVKHSEPPLSYKIGVRKNGLRNRQTLDGHDLLQTPDDYAEIEIADEGFEYFAKEVAELRLRRAKELDVSVPISLSEFLQDLTFREEAALLGAHKVAVEVLKEIESADKELFEQASSSFGDEIYFAKYWSGRDDSDVVGLVRDWLDNKSLWETRIGNHGYSSLFWLSKGNKGVRIRKYYCGQRVFMALPAGNIRYFLELIDTAIGHQLDMQENVVKNELRITPKAQTLAVRDVGQRRLNQLEGLADHGVQLKRLVLAIGKVFFELSRSPVGRQPEPTSFVVSGEPRDVEAIQRLLAEGVGHLAFEIFPRTKATSNHEMKDDEYRLHRIYTGFFEMSHRKKRRITFNARDLLKVMEDKPAIAISSMLGGADQTNEEDLPQQLAFFNAFYDGVQGQE